MSRCLLEVVMRAALLLLLLSLPAAAQVPDQLGYQGRLYDASGAPVTGVVSVRFALYDDPDAGTELWNETQQLGLTDGFYATFLDAPDTAFNGQPRYLELSVEGSTLAPRQTIGSVAYALKATEARNLAGGTVNASSVSVNGTQVIDPQGTVSWSRLSSVPAGFADGTDDGLMSVAHDATLLGNGGGSPLGVDPTEVQRRVSSMCAAGSAIQTIDVNGGVTCATAGGASYSAGPGLQLVGTTFSLNGAGCGNGNVLKWNGGGWACLPDDNSGGTVTAVTASAPLSASGGTAPNLSITQAGAADSGFLSSGDWNSFNGRLAAVSHDTTLTGSGTAVSPLSALPAPSGAVMFFNLASCPTGWSELTAARGRYLVGLPLAGTLAGTDGTALANLEDRPVGQHTHTGTTSTDGAHTHSLYDFFGGPQTASGALAGANSQPGSLNTSSAGAHSHTLNVTAAGATAGTNAPYLQLLVCQKD